MQCVNKALFTEPFDTHIRIFLRWLGMTKYLK